MTDEEALEIAAAINPRWRTLVITQPNEAWHNVRAIASGKSLASTRSASRPAVGGSFDGKLFKQIRDCPFRFKSNCGCAWPFRCWAAYGASVSHDDCVKCLKSRNLAEPT